MSCRRPGPPGSARCVSRGLPSGGHIAASTFTPSLRDSEGQMGGCEKVLQRPSRALQIQNENKRTVEQENRIYYTVVTIKTQHKSVDCETAAYCLP